MKNQKNSSLRAQRAAERKRHERTRNIAILGGVVVLAALLIFSFSRTQASGSVSVVPAKVGAPLGSFTLTDIHGNQVKLSDYAGKVVLLNAWATWCPPCRAEMPYLSNFYQAHEGEGFVILAVNAGDSKQATSDFANTLGLNFPVLLDPNTRLLNGLGIHSFPTSVVVGRDGVVKTIHVGMFTPDSLDTEIAPLISN